MTDHFKEPTGFKEVTREDFFAFVGPRNVHPHPMKHHVTWEFPERLTCGYSTPGYLQEGRRAYYLKS